MPASMPAKQQREQQRHPSALTLALVIGAGVLPKQASYPVGGFARDFRCDMAVSIHGQRDLAVPEDLHHDAGRDVLCEEQARGRMPEVVQADRRQLCPGEQLLEVAVVVARIDRRPMSVVKTYGLPRQRLASVMRSWAWRSW